MTEKNKKNTFKTRFQGLFPIVVDTETSGLNSKKNALLEIAFAILEMNKMGWIKIKKILNFHIIPFNGSILNPESLECNKIDPESPFRQAITEKEAIENLFKIAFLSLKKENCKKAVLVAHNSAFDHKFIKEAAKRSKIKYNPFHSFVTFDTATLGALIFGQTVLAKACYAAKISFNNREAHSALYDVKKTAELFCKIINIWNKVRNFTSNRFF
ncbi:ribonuclease T [bacterium endosymbiont of Pedicinus badii]|uniref:ribonuclease T n=1 Tax=bacterium endosymbiont of Pedicinus badii TaxID=1719126 RepID=UPI0009BC514B|nr:ribonuclease T [bacterium endosymbiont of Pedicinus badii]OQM34399.1 ribonuclease T [bacterium endosymbiont of Pedicinus badii]